MLYLIGGGLWSEKDISLEGLETAKKCDLLYLDTYTSVWGGQKGLEALVGTEIKSVDRSELEEDVLKIVTQAKEKNVGIIVPGDPMVATTHSIIVMTAKSSGVDVKVVHSSSILSAVAESGLHIYKFGKTISIPFPQDNYKPEAFYDNIKDNKRLGLHTLVLLDIGPERQMYPSEAVKILLDIEKKRKSDTILNNEKFVICSFKDERKILYHSIENIQKNEYPQPCCIIIPGRLHSTETEFIESFDS